GRARHVVETGVVEDLDRFRVTAVLAADAELEPLARLASSLRAHAHELADTMIIERLERIALEETLLEIRLHHPALDVVPAEPERHLSEVVRAEAEEVGLQSDFV